MELFSKDEQNEDPITVEDDEEEEDEEHAIEKKLEQFRSSSSLSPSDQSSSSHTNPSDSLTHVYSSLSSMRRFIVVEPNFRLYAFTNSSLHLRIIQFFAQVLYILPNLIVAQITRQSIRRAYAREMRSDQILNYIEEHYHPKASRYNSESMPKSVSKQVCSSPSFFLFLFFFFFDNYRFDCGMKNEIVSNLEIKPYLSKTLQHRKYSKVLLQRPNASMPTYTLMLARWFWLLISPLLSISVLLHRNISHASVSTATL